MPPTECIYQVSNWYLKACWKKVRKTWTDGWTDGQTNGRTDIAMAWYVRFSNGRIIIKNNVFTLILIIQMWYRHNCDMDHDVYAAMGHANFAMIWWPVNMQQSVLLYMNCKWKIACKMGPRVHENDYWHIDGWLLKEYNLDGVMPRSTNPLHISYSNAMLHSKRTEPGPMNSSVHMAYSMSRTKVSVSKTHHATCSEENHIIHRVH